MKDFDFKDKILEALRNNIDSRELNVALVKIIREIRVDTLIWVEDAVREVKEKLK